MLQDNKYREIHDSFSRVGVPQSRMDRVKKIIKGDSAENKDKHEPIMQSKSSGKFAILKTSKLTTVAAVVACVLVVGVVLSQAVLLLNRPQKLESDDNSQSAVVTNPLKGDEYILGESMSIYTNEKIDAAIEKCGFNKSDSNAIATYIGSDIYLIQCENQFSDELDNGEIEYSYKTQSAVYNLRTDEIIFESNESENDGYNVSVDVGVDTIMIHYTLWQTDENNVLCYNLDGEKQFEYTVNICEADTFSKDENKPDNLKSYSASNYMQYCAMNGGETLYTLVEHNETFFYVEEDGTQGELYDQKTGLYLYKYTNGSNEPTMIYSVDDPNYSPFSLDVTENGIAYIPVTKINDEYDSQALLIIDLNTGEVISETPLEDPIIKLVGDKLYANVYDSNEVYVFDVDSVEVINIGIPSYLNYIHQSGHDFSIDGRYLVTQYRDYSNDDMHQNIYILVYDLVEDKMIYIDKLLLDSNFNITFCGVDSDTQKAYFTVFEYDYSSQEAQTNMLELDLNYGIIPEVEKASETPYLNITEEMDLPFIDELNFNNRYLEKHEDYKFYFITDEINLYEFYSYGSDKFELVSSSIAAYTYNDLDVNYDEISQVSKNVLSDCFYREIGDIVKTYKIYLEPIAEFNLAEIAGSKDNVYSYAVAPNGESIYILYNDNGVTKLVRAVYEEKENVVTDINIDNFEMDAAPTYMRVSADGAGIFYTTQAGKSDFRVGEIFLDETGYEVTSCSYTEVEDPNSVYIVRAKGTTLIHLNTQNYEITIDTANGDTYACHLATVIPQGYDKKVEFDIFNDQYIVTTNDKSEELNSVGTLISFFDFSGNLVNQLAVDFDVDVNEISYDSTNKQWYFNARTEQGSEVNSVFKYKF